MSQDDTELDDQVRLLSGPEGSIRVVQMQPNQLSLKLWEPLCADQPQSWGAPAAAHAPRVRLAGPRERPQGAGRDHVHWAEGEPITGVAAMGNIIAACSYFESTVWKLV